MFLEGQMCNEVRHHYGRTCNVVGHVQLYFCDYLHNHVIHVCRNIKAHSREGEGMSKLPSVQFAQVRVQFIYEMIIYKKNGWT